jgi:hypothetical protein
MKLMTASITVRARIRAARAPFKVPFTASANCSFDAIAMKRGMLAAEVAAPSAAVQLERSVSFALAIDS